MKKWTIRMIGLLLLLVIGLVVFDGWFSPQIPPALQQDISLEVNGETQTIPAPPPPTPQQENGAKPQPAFSLTSLEDEVPEPQPILSNPGSDKAKARENAQIAANQKAAQNKTTAAPPANNKPPVAEAPVPTPEKTVEKPKPRRGGSWVQAGAFSSKENADNLVGQLQKKGWPVDTESANVNGKNVHRVFVGPLSAADVNTYIDILGKMGINARPITR
ncbi:MAG: SPOR domain-containing protein [Cardiobacteriaceae bacterium]|nr:SPOR domain-containing protein [Cardiobacteriaceae bacterium]